MEYAMLSFADATDTDCHSAEISVQEDGRGEQTAGSEQPSPETVSGGAALHPSFASTSFTRCFNGASGSATPVTVSVNGTEGSAVTGEKSWITVSIYPLV